MCSGRVDPQFVMKAFREGADGVMVLGCHPGDCHYRSGNFKAQKRFALFAEMLGQFGIEAGPLHARLGGGGRRKTVCRGNDQNDGTGGQTRSAGDIRGFVEKQGVRMSTKPKIALYWCASCGGCDETVVDLEEAILGVVDAVDIVFWPCAMDFKYEDVEALKDGELAVSFINGAIRSTEQEHAAKLLRRKSAAVVAFGSCACIGGIPALANLTSHRCHQKSFLPELADGGKSRRDRSAGNRHGRRAAG